MGFDSSTYYFDWHHQLVILIILLNRILLTSTSEVYGDPLVHPQDESYWGNVNPIGMFAILLTPYLDMVYLDFFEVAFLLGLNLIAS